MRIIKLMADYQCHPIWDMSPGQYGDIDPKVLPISENLKQQLAEWARSYDATLNMADPANSGFETEDKKVEFIKVGNDLVRKLRNELGSDYAVLVKLNN